MHSRAWCSGNMNPFQGLAEGSIPSARTFLHCKSILLAYNYVVEATRLISYLKPHLYVLVCYTDAMTQSN